MLSSARCVCQVSPEFKTKVMEVLTKGGFENMRSSKMSQDELLALLAAFNAAGIHFVWLLGVTPGAGPDPPARVPMWFVQANNGPEMPALSGS